MKTLYVLLMLYCTAAARAEQVETVFGNSGKVDVESLNEPQISPLKDNTGCPKIDLMQKDSDGMPFCPDAAKTNAWSVYRCAIDQAKSIHNPTKQEMTSMSKLLTGWTKENVTDMIVAAFDLNLQVCR